MRLLIEQKSLSVLISVIIISSFTYLTYERNKVWRDDVTLWRDAVEKAPYNARAHNNLGRAYGAQNRELEAIEEFKKAIEILPRYALAYMNMAVSCSRLGMTSDAEFYYKKAIELYPELPDTYYNYGFFLYSEERYKEAYEVLQRYIKLAPQGPFIPLAYKILTDIEKIDYGK